MSRRTMRPPGPVPSTVSNSMLLSRANLRASGDAKSRPLACGESTLMSAAGLGAFASTGVNVGVAVGSAVASCSSTLS